MTNEEAGDSVNLGFDEKFSVRHVICAHYNTGLLVFA